MNKYFNEDKWKQDLKHRDWYLRIKEEYAALLQLAEKPPKEEAKEIKEAVRSFFEDQLDRREIALATEGPDLDQARQTVDTIVIHHTSSPPGYRLKRMNVTHLLNIYAPYYANPYVHGEERLKGKPIWSNHLIDGRQVFYAYHWLLRMDGDAIRLLQDRQIGWHAGNWDINCRSVGICIDNDYENSIPSDDVIRALARLIKQHYSYIESNKVLGHREVNPKTICPGNRFLPEWKAKLLSKLQSEDKK